MRSERGWAEARGPAITTIVDLVGDRFTLDETQRAKQPDWTYATD